MFLTDNLGFFAGLNDFKFALKGRLRIIFWLGTTVHFGSPVWMTLDDFLGDFFAAKMMESSTCLLVILGRPVGFSKPYLPF